MLGYRRFSTAHFQGRRVPALEAGRIVWRDLLALVRVSARFVGIGIGNGSPTVDRGRRIRGWLLPQHDVNYYLKLRPPAFMVAASVIGGGCSNYCSGRGSTRGALALGRPGSDLRGRRAPDAFARSAALSQGFGGNWPV